MFNKDLGRTGPDDGNPLPKQNIMKQKQFQLHNRFLWLRQLSQNLHHFRLAHKKPKIPKIDTCKRKQVLSLFCLQT